MTPTLYERMLPFVTIYSQLPRVNPATAPVEVLRALPGASADMIARFVATRARSETALPALTGLEQFLSSAPARAVTIRSEGWTPGGGLFVREATVGVTGNRETPYVLRAWRQGHGAEATEAQPSSTSN
jgi:general secretion pathway protein K